MVSVLPDVLLTILSIRAHNLVELRKYFKFSSSDAIRLANRLRSADANASITAFSWAAFLNDISPLVFNCAIRSACRALNVSKIDSVTSNELVCLTYSCLPRLDMFLLIKYNEPIKLPDLASACSVSNILLFIRVIIEEYLAPTSTIPNIRFLYDFKRLS